MKTKTFLGKDAEDVESQIWASRKANPKISVTEIHSLEEIPATLIASEKYAPITAPDTVSKKIDYEDSE